MDRKEVHSGNTGGPVGRAGLFKSVEQVTTEPKEARVTGTIPEWVRGSLLRNGPALYGVGQDVVSSVFDGFALLHRFIIKDGKVSYQSRYLESDAYELAMAEQRIVQTGFGTVLHRDPCKSYFRHIFSYFRNPLPPDASDNCNVNWMQLGQDHYYAMTESNFMHRVDPHTLKSVKKVDISKYVAVNMATAHPHYENGVVYNMGSSFGRQTNFNIIKIPMQIDGDGVDPLDKATILCSIPSSTFNPAYFHSFGMTKNYIVFLEQPLVTNVFKLFTAKLREASIGSSLEYHPDWKSRFHLVNLHTGELLATKYLADAFFCFHFINAYEEDGHIVADICRFHDDAIIQDTSLDTARSRPALEEDSVRPVRFVLPLNVDAKEEELVTLAGTKATAKLIEPDTVFCTYEKLCDEFVEAPQINYKLYNGRPYRYFYGISANHRQLKKVDCATKEVIYWDADDEDYFPSEPVFVHNPDGKDEEDGVVLSLVCTSSSPSKNPFLLVLDARTYTEIARANVQGEMPFGFHGLFANGLTE